MAAVCARSRRSNGKIGDCEQSTISHKKLINVIVGICLLRISVNTELQTFSGLLPLRFLASFTKYVRHEAYKLIIKEG